MINDSFRLRYKNVPAAISVQTGCDQTPLHNHEEIEILIIDSGTPRVRVGEENFDCRPGDLIFVGPMEVHSVSVTENTEYRHRCVCFDTSLIFDKKIADGVRSGRMRLARRPCGEDAPELFLLCCRLFETLSREDAAATVEVPAYVGLIIGFFVRNGLLEKTESTARDSMCEKILEYIHGHFSENISSKTAAEALCFNQSYFCRKFAKNFGMRFSAYLAMYRVSVSRQLLEEGKTVSDVAYECGFSDPIYFSRCFKKYVGILPSEYRKKSI